jgi:hypothetical protein
VGLEAEHEAEMLASTAALRRLKMPTLTRLDGRSTPARKVKAVSARLKAEIDAGRRWSNIELDLLRHTALAVVLGEEAMNQAIMGKTPVADAAKAQSAARRATAALRATMERNLAEPKYTPDSLKEFAAKKYGYKP